MCNIKVFPGWFLRPKLPVYVGKCLWHADPTMKSVGALRIVHNFSVTIVQSSTHLRVWTWIKTYCFPHLSGISPTFFHEIQIWSSSEKNHNIMITYHFIQIRPIHFTRCEQPVKRPRYLSNDEVQHCRQIFQVGNGIVQVWKWVGWPQFMACHWENPRC